MLTNAKAGGRTVLGKSLFELIGSFTRRGLSVVISDFFSEGDTALELLRQLEAMRQEVIVFHLLAPEELDLPYHEEYLMEDSETGEELPVHAEVFRKEYQSRLGAFCDPAADDLGIGGHAAAAGCPPDRHVVAPAYSGGTRRLAARAALNSQKISPNGERSRLNHTLLR